MSIGWVEPFGIGSGGEILWQAQTVVCLSPWRINVEVGKPGGWQQRQGFAVGCSSVGYDEYWFETDRYIKW